MHLSTSLSLSLPVLAAAQAQIPLTDNIKAWFSSAKSYLPTSIPAVPSVPAAVKSPVAASAAKVAALSVHPVTLNNYEDLLTPDPKIPGPTEWMILVSGGNKTCGAQCTPLEVAFNETASLLAADPTAPHLGYINCDDQAVLCATWACRPPTIWHIQRPRAQPDQSSAPYSTIHVNYLNFTRTTAQDMVALHTGKKYEEGLLYEGLFHPFDGQLKKFGVNKLVGYVVFGFGLIPSWAFMLIVSMISRQVIAKRTAPNPDSVRRAESQRAGTRAGNAPLGGAPPANE